MPRKPTDRQARRTKGGDLDHFPIAKYMEGGKTHLDTFLSDFRGGKKAVEGMKSVAGFQHDNGPDPLAFIKKYDKENTSGAVKDSLDTMIKLQQQTKRPEDLMASIQQMQSILGSQLYSSMGKSGAASKAAGTVQKNNAVDIIKKLIAAALDKLTAEDAEKAADLLTDKEIQLITSAYYSGQEYKSGNEIQVFINAINQLMPIFRATYGVKR